jgi:3-oxoacyl-[acyl-carrier-protein] synthase III
VLSAVLRSDGSGGDLLAIPTVGSYDAPDWQNGHKMHKMYMNGGEVYKFATRVINESILQALDQAGLLLSDVSLIVPHQANMRIIQAAARTLKLDESMFVTNLDRYGNTSAASIPIALCEAIQQGRVKEDGYLVFVGFGGGLTWASMVVKWGKHAVEERPSGNFVKRQRRNVSYTLARWRAKLIRWSRRVDETISRIRPHYGRIHRLRHKIDRYPLE